VLWTADRDRGDSRVKGYPVIKNPETIGDKRVEIKIVAWWEFRIGSKALSGMESFCTSILAWARSWAPRRREKKQKYDRTPRLAA